MVAARNIKPAGIVVRIDIINPARAHCLGRIDNLVRIGGRSGLSQTVGGEHADASDKQEA